MIRKAYDFLTGIRCVLLKESKNKVKYFFLRLFTRKQYVLIIDPISMNWQYNKQNRIHASLSKVYGSPEVRLA